MNADPLGFLTTNMFMSMKPVILLLVLFVNSGFCASKQTDGETKILEDIVAKYGVLGRPVDPTNVSAPTPVDFEYYPDKLIKLDQVDEMMDMAAVIYMGWVDPIRLSWTPASYGGVTSLDVAVKSIWAPNVAHLRSTDAKFRVGSSGGDSVDIVNVEHTGAVTWLTGSTFKSNCDLDVRHFPFDVQTCAQTFVPFPDSGKFKLSNEDLNFTSEDRLIYYEPNSEWVVQSSTVTTLPGEMKVEFVLARKSFYYTLTIIIPSSLLTVLVFAIFLLPPDSGEKIGFGITVLLTFSVFQLLVSSLLPRTSDKYPTVGYIIIFLQFMSTLSLLVSVFVLNLHHFGMVLGGSMPRFVRVVVFKGLAYVTFQRSSVKKYLEDSATSVAPKIAPADEETIESEEKTPEKVQKSGSDDPMSELLVHVKRIAEKFKENDEEARIILEWKLAAIIVDRFLLLLTALVTTIGFLSFYGPTMVFVEANDLTY